MRARTPMSVTRSGLRICGGRVHREVREALIRYARWLRLRYEFPVRVPVYPQPTNMLRTRDGRSCSATFFAPFDRNVEPYIRIATGDYADAKRKLGRVNALAGILRSLSHEL